MQIFISITILGQFDVMFWVILPLPSRISYASGRKLAVQVPCIQGPCYICTVCEALKGLVFVMQNMLYVAISISTNF